MGLVREQKKHATRQARRKATLELGLLHGSTPSIHINDIGARARECPRARSSTTSTDGSRAHGQELDDYLRLHQQNPRSSPGS